MKRLILFIGLLFVSVLALFYIKDQASVEHSHYPVLLEQIEGLERLQNRLSLDLLAIENGTIYHYDTLTDDMANLTRGLQRLSRDRDGLWFTMTPEIEDVLTRLGHNVRLEEARIEDFKTHYAIFTNSVRYVASLTRDDDYSEMSFFTELPQFQTHLLDDIKDVFGYLQTGDPALRKDLEDEIAQVRKRSFGSQLSPVQRRVWFNILRHFEIILNEKSVVVALRDEILSLARQDGFSELGHLIQLQRDDELKRIDFFSKILTVLSLLLAAGMVNSLFSSIRKTSELRKTLRELENQKFALDQHAIVSITDTNGVIKYVNDRFVERTGYARDELIGQNHRLLKSDVHPKSFFRDMWQTILSGQVWHGDVCDLDKSGRRIWVSSTIVPFLDENGHPYQFMAIRSDLTKNKETERELFEAKERAQVILASVGDAVISIDRWQRIDYLNPVAEGLAGLESREVVGRQFDEIFEIIDEVDRKPASGIIGQCLESGHTSTLSANLLVNRIDGREFAVEIIVAPTHAPDGQITGAVLAMHDMTETRGLARKIAHQANTDPLTGLSNRHEFERILRKLLRKAREDDCEHVLCFIDLDHFKIVNDTCGHIAGDELLRQVAEILGNQIRDRDLLARIGGDEFALLLGECPMQRAIEIADTICHEIKAFRFSWEGKIFQIGASVGLAPINAQSLDSVTVMRHADTACYMAKDRGRNGYYVYCDADEEITQRAGEMNWISRLTHALDEQRFVIYSHLAQPLQGTRPYREILLRMRSSEGQIVSPMAFIPAAERHGLMADIDRWVIEFVLSRYARWSNRDEILAINLSGASLSDQGLAEYIIDKISTFGVDGRKVCFEITETAAIANLVSAMKLIESLKAEGCLFSLDDFGSGLSSFGYLKQLPVDFLKIDGVFVRDMLENHFDRAMVESINHIGHVMNLKTIAEFVEDKRIVSLLETLGVDYAQGFAFGEPEPFLVDEDEAGNEEPRIAQLP